MDSNKTNSPQLLASRGIAALETVCFLLILVPLVMGGLAIADFVYNSTIVHDIVDDFIDQVDVKTLQLSSFEQGYGLNGREDLEGPFLRTLNQQLANRLASRLGTDRFRGEVSIATFWVNDQSGEIRDDRIPANHVALPDADDDRPLSASTTREPNIILECFGRDLQTGGAYACPQIPTSGPIVGSLSNSMVINELISAAGDQAVGGGVNLNSLFSIPSALFGTRLQHHYGPSKIFGAAQARYPNAPAGTPRSTRYIAPYATSDYFRKATVVGIAVEVPLSETKTDYLFRALRGLTAGTSGTFYAPTISVKKLFSPRVDF